MKLLEKTIAAIKTPNKRWEETAQLHLDNLTKPPGSLGRIEEFARRLITIAGGVPSLPLKKAVFVFAGDHGVAAEEVSAYPKEVTAQMVLNFLRGGAGINVLARHVGAEVIVVDIGVDHDFGDLPGMVNKKVLRGTANFSKGPAMTKEQAVGCLEAGIELAQGYARGGFALLATGDMGIGNTTPSSAIAAVLTGRPVLEVTGRGTGITPAALAHKVWVITQGIEKNRPRPEDPLDVLAKVGGTEIGGIAGLILGAAAAGLPVAVDGFISTAGALIARGLSPRVTDYLFAAHNSVEIGHRAMLDKLGLRPVFDLDLRLGEGTGAALAMNVIEAGLKIYKEMATFGEAGVAVAKDG